MKALECSIARFSIECPRRYFMGAQIIQQRTGDRGLANAPFVRTDEDNGWLAHCFVPPNM
jgi:hypothetical protein